MKPEMQTFTGKLINYLDVNPEDISLTETLVLRT
jgi:hypothetical protein